MNMTQVESSNIAEIGHDGKDMEVLFKSGKAYRYQGVPTELFEKIRDAKSVGSSFNSLVKKFPEEYPYSLKA